MKTGFNLAIIATFVTLVVVGSIDIDKAATAAADLGQTMILALCGILFCVVAIIALVYLGWRQSTADEREADNAELQLQTAQAGYERAQIAARSHPWYTAAMAQNELMQNQLDIMRQIAQLWHASQAAQAALAQAASGHAIVKNALGVPMEQTKRRGNTQPEALQNEVPKPLLPAIRNKQRLLVVGASDSGKTTLLRHIIDERDNPLVIDPHGTPPKWGRVKHVGQGRDYRAIRVTLDLMIDEMNRRYADLGEGVVSEGHHQTLTLVVDEWRAIIKNIKGAGEQLSTLLTEARKASMDCIIATHSERVKALGIDGEGDLRKGFTVVRLYGGNGDPDRYATVSHNGGGEVRYELPGPYPAREFQPFVAGVDQGTAKPPSVHDLAWIVASDIDPVEQVVIRAYQGGASLNECYRVKYQVEQGKALNYKPNARQRNEIKNILSRHNIPLNGGDT